MMTRNATPTPVRALVRAWMAMVQEVASANGHTGVRKLKVFVECDPWLEDEVRPADDFVTCVDDADEADVCMTVVPDTSHGRARHYRVHFAGAGAFAGIEASARLHLPRRRIVTFPRLRPASSASATA
jgi:hypothetical protein